VEAPVPEAKQPFDWLPNELVVLVLASLGQPREAYSLTVLARVCHRWRALCWSKVTTSLDLTLARFSPQLVSGVLARLPALRAVRTSGWRAEWTAALAENHAALRALELFELDGRVPSAIGLFRGLRDLVLHRPCTLDLRGAEAISRLPRLAALHVARFAVADAPRSIQRLCEGLANTLCSLTLGEIGLVAQSPEEHATTFRLLTRLCSLTLDSAKSAAVLPLVACLPGLTSLSLLGLALRLGADANEGLAQALGEGGSCSSLRRLDLSFGCGSFTLPAWIWSPRNLHTLSLRIVVYDAFARAARDFGLASVVRQFGTLPGPRKELSICCAEDWLSPDTLAIYLTEMRGLRRLHLDLEDDGMLPSDRHDSFPVDDLLSRLGRCAELEELEIERGGLGAVGCRALQRMTSLRTLRLTRCGGQRLRDEVALRLRRLTSLRMLDLTWHRLRASTVDSLRAAIPFVYDEARRLPK
ncbi:Hypothetical protein UVM_LOCUS103, partial [uncultured virus]